MQGFTSQFETVENLNPTSRIYGVVQGQFILDGNVIFLQTLDGNQFSLERVDFLTNAFNDKDGNLRFPKPFRYDQNGNEIEKGDLVLIAFEKGDIFTPIVLGSILPIRRNEFFHNFTSSDYQKKKSRYKTEQAIIEYQDDGKGEIQLDITAQEGKTESGTGNITLNLTGFGSNNGNIIINVNGNVAINSEGTATVKGDTKVIVDSPLIELGRDSTEKLIKGNLWSALFQAHTHPTPAGPSGVPVNANQADNCLSDQNTTL